VRAAGEDEVVAVVVVVVVVAGEVAVVAGAGDVFVAAGEVFAVVAGEVFAAADGELCPKANPAGKTARRAMVRIEVMCFIDMEPFFVMRFKKEARPECGTLSGRATSARCAPTVCGEAG